MSVCSNTLKFEFDALMCNPVEIRLVSSPNDGSGRTTSWCVENVKKLPSDLLKLIHDRVLPADRAYLLKHFLFVFGSQLGTEEEQHLLDSAVSGDKFACVEALLNYSDPALLEKRCPNVINISPKMLEMLRKHPKVDHVSLEATVSGIQEPS